MALAAPLAVSFLILMLVFAVGLVAYSIYDWHRSAKRQRRTNQRINNLKNRKNNYGS
jgi:nicotinamide riboside transporter PnuC